MLRSAYGCCLRILTFLIGLAGCSAVTFAQAPLGATLDFGGNAQFPAATVTLTVTRPGQTRFAGSNGKVERGTPLFSAQVEAGATFYPCDSVFGFPQPIGNNPSINRLGASSFIAIKETTNGTKKVWINASVGAWRISGGFISDWEYQIRYYSGDAKKNEPATITAGIIPNAGFYGGSAASGTAEVKFPDLPDLLGSISKRDLNFPNGFRPGSLGTISMKLLNNSPVAALGTIDVGFYLSKDTVWDPASDVPLGVVTLALGELGPGVLQEVTSLPVLVPSALPTNNFYILAPIDISHRIPEFIETNNTPYLEMEYITVTGTVKDRETEKPLGGVDIRLTTGRSQSNAKGEFSVRGLEPGPDDRLILSKKGYEELQFTVDRPAGATSIDQGEILMPPETDLPVVMQLKADLSGFIFIQDVKGLKNLYTVSIKWKGHQPNAVEFSNGRGWTKTVSTTDDTAWVNAGIEETFTPSLVPDFNRIEAVAITKDGQRSKPLKVSFFLVPMPRFLIGKNILPVGFKLDWVPPAQVGIDFEFPRTQVEKEFDLPLLGRSGVSFKFNGGFDYWMNSGRWKVEIGSSADGKAVSRATRRPTYEGGVRTPPLRV